VKKQWLFGGMLLILAGCDGLPVEIRLPSRLMQHQGEPDQGEIQPQEVRSHFAELNLYYAAHAEVASDLIGLLREFERCGFQQVRINSVLFHLNIADRARYDRKKNHFVIRDAEEIRLRLNMMEPDSLVVLQVGRQAPWKLLLDVGHQLNARRLLFEVSDELGEGATIALLEMATPPASNVFIRD
jgi:hypothetical protein